MHYAPENVTPPNNFPIYRGITKEQWCSRAGITRKGNCREADFYAGDTRIYAGAVDIYTGTCIQNALTATAIGTDSYKYSWLSFSKSLDVAIFFALNEQRHEAENSGIIIESDIATLKTLGIFWMQNNLRFPWEQEISIDLSEHELLPTDAILQIHKVDGSNLWKAANNLQKTWGGSGLYTRIAIDEF